MRPTHLAIACILLSLSFAGCLSDSDASGSDQVNAKVRGGKTGGAPGVGTFVATLPDGSLADPSMLLDLPPIRGVQSFIGYESYEPTLGIHPKSGAVFMSALDFKGPGGMPRSFVYATADQGATWKDVSPKVPAPATNPPISFDPFVHVDQATGRVFSADLQALLCNWLMWSEDEGKTWTTNPAGCGNPPGVHDHQSITTGKARSTPSTWSNRMVYYCVNRIGDSSCSASNNGGLVFGPLIPVLPGVDVERGGFCGGLHGHVKTDNAGRVFLPKVQCGIPTVGISEDDGRTWKAVKISSVGGRDHEVVIAADAADNVYAFWIGENGLPHLSMSNDHGSKWSPARVVSPPGVTAADKPALYASATGKIAFAYVGTTHEGGYQKNRNATSWVGATWNAYLGVMTDALAEKPIVLTTTINDPADPIAINQCGGTRCQGLYDFIDLDIDAQGRPWVALVDVCHDKCIQDFAKDPRSARHDGNKGFAGTLASGPALTAEGGALPALAWVTAPALAQ